MILLNDFKLKGEHPMKGLFFIPLLIIGIVVSFCYFSLGDSPKMTNQYLIKMGYTDIQTTGYNFFGCQKDKWAIIKTDFFASAPNGARVIGTYCWEPIGGSYLNARLLSRYFHNHLF